jgi:predicted acylesterase/phospholipase RssA
MTRPPATLPHRTPNPLIVMMICAGLLLAACASPPAGRVSYGEGESRNAEVPGMPGVRFWVDSPASFQRWSALRAGQSPYTPARQQPEGLTWLAISGGAEDGAYGAGILSGWTAAGTRPQFTVVSGVSTGALIAVFAFLGPQHDAVLASIYTDVPRERIYRAKALPLPTGESYLDDAPFRERVAEIVDARMLAEIAREHAAGRRLLVVTTNLDAQRGTVWDMGAIASSGHPAALKLFRDVIIASASPPGLFTPTYIEVEGNGRRFREMHVDGAIGDPVFNPASVLTLLRLEAVSPGPIRRTLYIIVNNRLGPEFDYVRSTMVPIVARSFSTLAKRNLRAEVDRAYRAARDSAIEFNLAYIDNRLAPKPPAESFDLTYRRQLYAHARQRMLAGAAWLNAPPAPTD